MPVAMYFSRITIDPYQINPKNLINFYKKGVYGEHQFLWKLFEKKDSQRSFLYRQERNHNFLKYYVLSKNIPYDTMGLNLNIESKQYNPHIQKGQLLDLSLRANPTISINKKRHDVIMHEKKKYSMDSKKPPLQKIVQNSGLEWFEKCAKKNGFSFDREMIFIDGYRQNKGRKNQNYIRYSTIDITGKILVEDAHLFQKTLIQGVGKSKAFGCGLMLIRKI